MVRQTTSEIITEGDYLNQGFDPTALVISQLTGILAYHQIQSPAKANKDTLIEIFNREVKGNGERLRLQRLHMQQVPASTDGIVDATGNPIAPHSDSDSDSEPEKIFVKTGKRNEEVLYWEREDIKALYRGMGVPENEIPGGLIKVNYTPPSESQGPQPRHSYDPEMDPAFIKATKSFKPFEREYSGERMDLDDNENDFIMAESSSQL